MGAQDQRTGVVTRQPVRQSPKRFNELSKLAG